MQRAIPSTQQGATFVELVVTLALLMGLLATAAPALGDLVQAAHLSAASTELVADLQLARAEALRRNRRVTMCKSLDGSRCSANGGWEQGWIVFHDDNGNGERDPDEHLLQQHGPLPWTLRLVGNQPVAAYISYTTMGASKLTGGGFQAGTLTVCRRSGAPTPARQVIVNAIGRPRVQRATVDSCV